VGFLYVCPDYELCAEFYKHRMPTIYDLMNKLCKTNDVPDLVGQKIGEEIKQTNTSSGEVAEKLSI